MRIVRISLPGDGEVVRIVHESFGPYRGQTRRLYASSVGYFGVCWFLFGVQVGRDESCFYAGLNQW